MEWVHVRRPYEGLPMARVLIPFVDPEGARRAVVQLLAETRDPRLAVHLLAAVEPRVSGKVRIFMSPERAQAAVRDAAQRWLAPLEAMLAAAGVPCTSEVVVGPTWAAIREASSRPDIDRVLLPVKRHSWRGWQEHSGYALHSPHRVTLVA